jgi:hypothetical protein
MGIGNCWGRFQIERKSIKSISFNSFEVSSGVGDFVISFILYALCCLGYEDTLKVSLFVVVKNSCVLLS